MKTFYVARGRNPKEWAELGFMGPFPSEAKAREAIRKDTQSFVDGLEDISTGKHTSWCDTCHILELVRAFNPIITISAKVSLQAIKPETQTSHVKTRSEFQ